MCSRRCMCGNNDNTNPGTNTNTNTNNNINYNVFRNALGNELSTMGYNTSNNGSFGYAYVPFQPFSTVFSPAEGLANGTMFPELVSPYYPNQSMEVMNYLRYYNNRGGFRG